MFLLLLIASAFSTETTTDQAVVSELTRTFVVFGRPTNIGCDTNQIAVQLGITGWSPMCSSGTLTAVSNMLTFSAYRFNPNDSVSDFAWRESKRQWLSKPSNVRAAYRDLKPFALGSMLLADKQKADEIRHYLTDTLVPVFTLEVSTELRTLYATEGAAYEAMLASRTYDGTHTTWDPETEAAYDAANLAFGNAAIASGFHDPLALQWRLRRESEGGQKLVAAYREIFTDFAKSF